MKKKICMVLILSLILMVCACGKNKDNTSGQGDGELSAPAEGLPQLTEAKVEPAENSVGLMAFYPNDNKNMYALAGTNCVTFYFENKDIKLGTGKIGIYESENNSIYSSVDVADTTNYHIDAMDSVGTSITGWSSGTKIDIYFSKVFEKGKSYYILMDEGVFKLGNIDSAAVADKTLIQFSTKNYGIDASMTNLNNDFGVGKKTTIRVFVDGEDATMYALKGYDENFILPSQVSSSMDDTLTLTFMQDGKPSITIAFFKGGKEVDSITFTFNVVGLVDEPAESSSESTIDEGNVQ